jgi:hypothetical protein
MNKQEVKEMIKRSYVASLLVVAAVVGGVTLVNINKQNNGSVVTYADVPVGSARLALSQENITAKVGEEFTVDLLLSTSNDATTGVDAMLRYDATLLEVVDADTAAAGVQIKPGTLFDFIPYNATTLATGVINFSASQQPNNTPVTVAQGKLASVTFKAKAAGKASVAFAFTPGLLDDSNVVKPSDGRDLLSTVGNASVTISR